MRIAVLRLTIHQSLTPDTCNLKPKNTIFVDNGQDDGKNTQDYRLSARMDIRIVRICPEQAFRLGAVGIGDVGMSHHICREPDGRGYGQNTAYGIPA